MTIYDFADSVNKNILITRYPNQEGRFCASIEDAEIKDGLVLASLYGNGTTAINAINDYSGKITKKRIVFGAYTTIRQEYDVPRLDNV